MIFLLTSGVDTLSGMIRVFSKDDRQTTVRCEDGYQ